MNKPLIFILSGILVLLGFSGCRTSTHSTQVINIGEDMPYVEDNHFRQGSNRSPDGKVLGLNNYFLTHDGKPILPVMGEIHYTRYPKSEWEEVILKMKASGITTIATYCFWIHHEEEDGIIRFDGNLDIRYFLELCQKHNLWAFVRIGPWCHGECINGGYPDWYQIMIGQHRLTEVTDLNEASIRRWYEALAGQFEGLYYKDGGPVIGLQVDNEVPGAGQGRDTTGYNYIKDLKKIALESGIDVPLYTATGWNGIVPEEEVMPVYGGYPGAPWTQHSRQLSPVSGYLFSSDRLDPAIGTDLGLNSGEGKEDRNLVYRHPYLTVEMGGGNQITYHRRPRFQTNDVIPLVYAKLGVGANSMGYYVYHGAQHPLSWHGEFTTQESKSGGIFPYPNDYPLISYDFHAPLTEWGFARDYYHDFKLIHLFLNNFGSDLARMYPVIPANTPDNPTDSETLRYSVRSRNGSGYLFISNTVRHLEMKDHMNTRFTINTANGSIQIPDGSFNIKNGVYAIFPFNLGIEDVVMTYATAHPFARIENDKPVLFFYSVPGIIPEYKFESKNISSVELMGFEKKAEGEFTKMIATDPEADSWFSIKTAEGKEFTIYNVSHNKARFAYQFKLHGSEHLMISDKLIFNDETKSNIELRSLAETNFRMQVFPDAKFRHKNLKKGGREGLFSLYEVDLEDLLKGVAPEIEMIPQTSDKAFQNYCKELRHNPEGPQHKIRLDPRELFLKYTVKFPREIPSELSNYLVEFDYAGNTASLYANGVLIADDFYSGYKMPVGLKRFENKLADNEFIFQLTPLLKDYNIYFEEDTDLKFAENEHAYLKGVKITPEYRIEIKYQDE